MTSRQEKIRDLVFQNRRRRNLEIVVPQLQQIFGDDFAESKLSIIEPTDLPERLSRTWADVVHHVWSFDDRNSIESFCFAFAGETDNAMVKLLIPQLKYGLLEISLSAVLKNSFDFLQAFDSLWFYEPQTLAEFDISKHTYYYYGDDVKHLREYKWELNITGFWSEAARRYLNGG